MIPFDRVIWSAEECAAYLGVSKIHFLNALQYADGFPKPLPPLTYSAGSKRRQMASRWQAQAVSDWALGKIPHQLRNQAA